MTRKRKNADLKNFFQAVFAALLFCARLNPAVFASPGFEVHPAPDCSLKQGNDCSFALEIIWKKGEGNFLLTQPELQLENLALDSIGQSNETFESQNQQWSRKTLKIKLKPLQKGRGIVRSFQINYIDPQTGENGHFEIPRLEIKIHGAGFSGKVLGTTVFLSGLGGLLALTLIRFQKKSRKAIDSNETASLEDRFLELLKSADAVQAYKIFQAYLREKYQGKPPEEEQRILNKIFGRLNEQRFGGEEPGSKVLYMEMIQYLEGKRVV